MPVAAVPGNIRFRATQAGLQSDFASPVVATRRLPWRFAPTVDPHWTTPDVDTGTLDPAIAPYRTAIDVTGQLTGPLAADDASFLWAAFLGPGGVTPSSLGSGAYQWDFDPSANTLDPYDVATLEWGDDVVGDQWQFVSTVGDQLQLSYPQDLGPIAIQGDTRSAAANYPVTMTSGLDVDTNPQWLYAADTALYIDDNAGAIGISQLVDTMHDAQIQISRNTDVKRYANGSNVNFAAVGYGPGARTVQTTITLAKTPAGLAEAVKWLNASPVERFLSLVTTSREVIGGGSIHPMQRIRLAGYWFTRSEQAVNSNSAIQLVCQHVWDPALTSPFSVRVVNRMASLLAPA